MLAPMSGILFGALFIAGAVQAQDGPRGHWTGAIDLSGQSLAVEIDLDKTTKEWVGSIAIPAQNASGLPLESISVTNGQLKFRIKGGPGEPTFNGALSKDGQTITGDFTQGGSSFPFKLSRSGDAKVEELEKSPPVSKQFLGTWEGTIDAGQPLRLRIKINNKENEAEAVLVSLDQGGAEIPVTTIEQQNGSIKLVVKAVGGEYRGEISKDGTELDGTWTQGGNDLPLKLIKK
jgi:hypothetical protein